jgi:hypothetical protein
MIKPSVIMISFTIINVFARVGVSFLPFINVIDKKIMDFRTIFFINGSICFIACLVMKDQNFNPNN